jgi:two-component system nitrogen regulation response regulator NtrX
MSKVSGAGSILIGSSDRDLLDKLGSFLSENFGKKVVSVGETSDFLLEILDKRVDLTIIDVGLAGLSTAKTIQIFKKSRPDVPVIVISGDYSVETGSRIMEQGVFYYLYKPLELDSLKEIVQSALNKLAKEVSGERR